MRRPASFLPRYSRRPPWPSSPTCPARVARGRLRGSRPRGASAAEARRGRTHATGSHAGHATRPKAAGLTRHGRSRVNVVRSAPRDGEGAAGGGRPRAGARLHRQRRHDANEVRLDRARGGRGGARRGLVRALGPLALGRLVRPPTRSLQPVGRHPPSRRSGRGGADRRRSRLGLGPDRPPPAVRRALARVPALVSSGA